LEFSLFWLARCGLNWLLYFWPFLSSLDSFTTRSGLFSFSPLKTLIVLSRSFFSLSILSCLNFSSLARFSRLRFWISLSSSEESDLALDLFLDFFLFFSFLWRRSFRRFLDFWCSLSELDPLLFLFDSFSLSGFGFDF